MAVKQFENTGSIYRKERDGQLIIVDTTENQMKVETVTSSQEDRPGTHDSVQTNCSENGLFKTFCT